MTDEQRQAIVDDLLEVELAEEDDFLKVRETLTRMGLASRPGTEGKPTLFQSCHILHKRGKFYLVHFKELFKLDGKTANFDEQDLLRRNMIANTLQKWELLTIKNPSKAEPAMSLDKALENGKIVLLPYREKGNWNLEAKYNIGKFKRKKDGV